jgi:hypothetical protein
MQFLSFCAWLISFSTTSSMFICVANDRMSPFLLGLNSINYVYTPHFLIHSSDYEHT